MAIERSRRLYSGRFGFYRVWKALEFSRRLQKSWEGFGRVRKTIEGSGRLQKVWFCQAPEGFEWVRKALEDLALEGSAPGRLWKALEGPGRLQPTNHDAFFMTPLF